MLEHYLGINGSHDSDPESGILATREQLRENETVLDELFPQYGRPQKYPDPEINFIPEKRAINSILLKRTRMPYEIYTANHEQYTLSAFIIGNEGEYRIERNGEVLVRTNSIKQFYETVLSLGIPKTVEFTMLE